MSDCDEVKIHRVQFRFRSGNGVRELENLAWEEFQSLKTNTEKQRFLSEHFLAGYALNRAGITRDATVLGVQIGTSDGTSVKENGDSSEVNPQKKSTVNKQTQEKLGSLLSV